MIPRTRSSYWQEEQRVHYSVSRQRPVPNPDSSNPKPGQHCPNPGKHCPEPAQHGPEPGQNCPEHGWHCPKPGQNCPELGQHCPEPGHHRPESKTTRSLLLTSLKKPKNPACCIQNYPGGNQLPFPNKNTPQNLFIRNLYKNALLIHINVQAHEQILKMPPNPYYQTLSRNHGLSKQTFFAVNSVTNCQGCKA